MNSQNRFLRWAYKGEHRYCSQVSEADQTIVPDDTALLKKNATFSSFHFIQTNKSENGSGLGVGIGRGGNPDLVSLMPSVDTQANSHRFKTEHWTGIIKDCQGVT